MNVMSWNPNRAYDVYVGYYSFVTKPSKTDYGSISIRYVVDKVEFSNYYIACMYARTLVNAHGMKYACSVVPHGLRANCLQADYIWNHELAWKIFCDR